MLNFYTLNSENSFMRTYTLKSLLFLAAFFISTQVWGQTILANYKFENNLNAESGAIGSPVISASASVSYFGGVTGNAASFASANGKFFELTISTAGYENITIDWQGRTSSTTSSWVITGDDGSGYGGTLLTHTLGTSFTSRTYSFGTAFDNKATIKIRWTANVSATQTVRIDDVVVKGTAIVSACTAPATQASNITFPSVGQTQMDVNWTNGNGAGRVVIMNTTNSFTSPANGSNPTANTTYSGSGEQVVFNGTGSGPITINGLSASTTYHFRVYEYCSPDRVYQTTTATNNPNNQTTNTATSCTEPTVVHNNFTGTSNTGIVILYEPTAVGNLATVITERGIEYANNISLSGSVINSETGSFLPASTFRTLSGLNANTQYWGRAFAVNNCATPLTGYSNLFTFTTKHNKPNILAATLVGVTAFTAQWQPNNTNNAGGAAFTYTLEYGTNPTLSTVLGTFPGISSGNTSQLISGLQPGTTYYYRVRIENAGGSSEYSDIQSVITLNSVGLSINATTGTEAATTQITLTVTAGAPVVGNQSVNVALSGTGVNNADFTGVTFPTTITILNGQASGTLTFNIADDNVAESTETATFTISNPSAGIVLGTPLTRNLTITNNPLTYIELTALNVPATEDFAGMGSNGSAPTPTGFGIQDGNSTTIASAVTQQASSGTPTAGGAYNWGQSTTERALGLMFSSGYNNKSILAAVKNSTGGTGSIFEIKFNYEQYRRNSTTQTFKLQYSTSLTAGWVDVPGGNFASIVTNSTSSYGFNPLIASEYIDIQFTPAATVANNQVVYFRWILDGGSNSSGVGIDDFSIALITVSCSTPTTQISNTNFSGVTQNAIDFNFTVGDGSNRVVYINSTNSFTAPTDGAALPSVNTTWANSGQQLIYNGSGNSASVSGLSAGTTYYFRVYEYNCTGSNTKFLNTTTTYNQATNIAASTASVVQAVSNSEANTISSLVNGTIVSNSNGVQVWRFRLYDGNGISNDADNMPTIYTGWTIRASADNTVPNWSTAIADRKFFLGTSITPITGGGLTNPNNIPFPISSPFITVPDDGFVDVFMRITLANPLPVGSDGQKFGFSLVPADITVASSATSSQLGSFSATSNGTKNIIDVLATLKFIDAPTNVVINNNFTITVSAVDANGNIDQNQTGAITLSQFTGSGTFSGGSTQNLVGGSYTWTGLTYDEVGTFQVRAQGGAFAPVFATINATNDPFQLFDDFNRANNNIVGIPSSGGTTLWSETETGDGSRIRISNNRLILSNCNSDGSNSGNGFEQVAFDMTPKYETLFDNANGTMNWKFNLRSTRSGPSGFSITNTYGIAAVLGCDESDYQSASADGYAVIIGNTGTPNPVKLVRFTNGLISNSNITDVAVSSYTGETGYLSINVFYNPCNNEWSLWVRNDGSDFADPNAGSFGSAFTGVDNAHTSKDLKYSGFAFQHGASCSEIVSIDNFYIPNAGTLVAGTTVWTGALNNLWHVSDNWYCGVLPNSTINAVIPNVTNAPEVIDLNPGNVKDVIISNNAEITIFGELNVYGNFTNSGGIVTGEGTLSFKGSLPQSINGNFRIGILEVDNNNGVQFAFNTNALIDEKLVLKTGNLNTNNGTVTLKSSAARTAYIDDFTSGYNGTITTNNNLTIERYIPVVANPLSATPFAYLNRYFYIGSITNNITTASKWNGQFSLNANAGANNSNTVTPKTDCSREALAQGSPFSNLFAYDESRVQGDCYLRGWIPLNASATIERGKGYAARINDPAIINSNRLLSETGNYSKLPVTFNNLSISANNNSASLYSGQFGTKGHHIISNPFWAPIDWRVVATNNASVYGTAYKFNPATGNFLPLNNSGVVPVEIGTNEAIIILPLDANQSSYNITIPATARVNSTSNSLLRQQQPYQYKLEVKVQSADNESDKAYLIFDNSFTETHDNGFDAKKMFSSIGVPSIYTKDSNNERSSILALPENTQQTTIPLGVAIEYNGNHTLTFEGVEDFPNTSIIWLEDLQTGTIQYLRNNNTYSFTANKTDNADRFLLHFAPELLIASTDANCDNENGNINITERGGLEWTYTLTDENSNVITNSLINGSQQTIGQLPSGTYTLQLTNTISGYQTVETVTVNQVATVTAAISIPNATVNVGDMVTVDISNTTGATNTSVDMGDGTVYNNESIINHSYTIGGNYTITVNANNDNCADAETLKVEVMDIATSIANNNQDFSIEVYASQNNLYVIQRLQEGSVDTKVEVYNMLGQIVTSETINAQYQQAYSISMNDIAKGTYIARVIANGKTSSKRIIISE